MIIRDSLHMKLVAKAAIYGSLVHKHRVRRRQLLAGYSALTAVVILSTVVLQVWFQLRPLTLKLDEKTYSLIGQSREDTRDYLKENEDKTAFEFVVPKTTEPETSKHTGRVEDAFSTSFSKDVKEGVTLTDTTSKIAVTLVPQFTTTKGQKVDGDHIVYQMGSKKLVYTLKYNGLKEDIIIPTFQGNQLDFSFTLRLPSGVEARKDDQGNIGIYSSDPTLFGNISYGSEEDRAKVDKARENGPKTNQVMSIPAPIVKDATGLEHTDKSIFQLSNKQTKQTKGTPAGLPADAPQSLTTISEYQLTIESKNLKDLAYPISIDPTMQVTSAADFGGVNMEGGVEINNAQIQRSKLTGGSVGSWSTSGHSTGMGAVEGHSTVISNGYIYTLGSDSTGVTSLVQAASISSTGTIGTWTTSGISQLPTDQTIPSAVAYNGHLYIIAGFYNIAGGAINTVRYAKQNSDGTLSAPQGAGGCTGAWCTLSSTGLLTRYRHNSFVANGYVYALGGCSHLGFVGCDTWTNTVSYAKIQSDGSLAIDSDGAGSCTTTWCATTAFTTPLEQIGVTYFNGYVYKLGGYSLSTSAVATVEYAKVNVDGTVGTWIAAASIPIAGTMISIVASNGYLYLFGGLISGQQAITQYAQINADGSLGTGSTATTWRQMPSMTVNRQNTSAVAYAGFLYVTGGNSGAGPQASTERAQINPAGVLHGGDWESGPALAGSARYGVATVVHNGFVYILGGCSRASGLVRCASGSGGSGQLVDRAQINSDGTLGSWVADNPMPSARTYADAVAHEGYLYVFGGCIGTGNSSCGGGSSNMLYASINATTGALTWSTDSTDALGHQLYKVFNVGNQVYHVGGCDNTGGTYANCGTLSRKADVFTATLSGSTGVGAWTPSSALPTPRAAFGLAKYGKYVYLTGGFDASGVVSSVLCADTTNMAAGWTNINCTGSTGHPAVFGHNIVASNGYLYSYGGCTNNNFSPTEAECGAHTQNATYYAKINSNGSVGAWQSTQAMTQTTAKPRVHFGGAAIGDKLYAFAGHGGDDTNVTTRHQNTTTFQTINNGGSGKLANWSLSSSSGLTGRFIHSVAVHNGYIYAIGGCNGAFLGACTSQINTINYAAVNTDGSLGNWSTTTTLLPASAYHVGHAVTVYGGYLYIAGGSGGVASTATYSVPFGANGNITAAWTQQSNLNSAWYLGGSSVINGRWYLTGGYNGSSYTNTTMFATLQSSGGLSAWTNSSGNQNFDTARAYHATVANNGYLYVIGGCSVVSTNCPGGYLSDIQYTRITNSDGSISNTAGAWKTLNPSYLLGVHFAGVAAYNGYLYIIANYHELGAFPQRTLMGAFLADGSIGNFYAVGQDAASQVGDARYVSGSSPAAVYNGRLYLVSGTPDFINTVTTSRYVTLQSIPRIGTFSKLYDLDTGVRPTKLITRGTKQNGSTTSLSYMNTNNTGTSFGSATSSSDIAYDGANALTLALGANTTLSRYFFLRYTIDDCYSAVFPDSGNESNITDFDLYYTSNPGRRLRNGRTFTTGNNGQPGDRGLQTSPQ